MEKYLERQSKNTTTYIKRDAIVQDVLVHNFPIGPNGTCAITGETTFDIKTLQIDKIWNFYPTNKRDNGTTSGQ